MPITTYLNPGEVKSFKVTDKDVLEWMNEIEKMGVERLIIEEREHEVRAGWFKKKKEKIYSVYFDCYGNGCEYQIMNFCQSDDWSINTSVPKHCIVNYLIGYAGGIQAKRLTPSPAKGGRE